MKKLENLNEEQFVKFESDKIKNLINITGGYITSPCTQGCYDTYDWTPRKLASGATVNDTDNLAWWTCTTPRDTCRT